MQKVQRFYFDTSVFGGVFDVEFEEVSVMLFERMKLMNIDCLASEVTVRELTPAPPRVRDFFNAIPGKTILSVSEETTRLADLYVAEGVVGATSFDDCLHIALATIHRAGELEFQAHRQRLSHSRIQLNKFTAGL